jgi:transcriptional regulator with XRE-family HTH domain
MRPMISPPQSRAARGLLEWSQEELASQANLGLSTIRDFEKGATMPVANNLSAMRHALEAGGIQFIAENGGGPGVRLAKRQGKGGTR